MYKHPPIFSENFRKYDAAEKWQVTGDDATYGSRDDHLITTKTNTDAAANYISLKNKFNSIYNFKFAIDIKINKQSGAADLGIVELLEDSTRRALIRSYLGSTRFQAIDEDNAQIGSNFTIEADKFYRIKIIQYFFGQTSTTGIICVFAKDLSNPDDIWNFLGQNELQSGGINDIRVGHPESSNETYQFRFRNSLLREISSHEIENISI